MSLVYDCCMVFQELDMLDLRFAILNDAVDYFVIVESGMTHSGKPKSRTFWDAFEAGRYDAYKDQIIYAYLHELEGAHSWDRERFNRAHIGNILQYNAAPEDWVIVADADEIPTPEAIELVRSAGGDAAALELALYYYNFSTRVHQGWGIGMCKWSVCQDANAIRRCEFGRAHVTIKDAGYHLSYFLTPEGIADKLDAFMHHADVAANVPRDPAWIAEKMRAGQDLFGRTTVMERVATNGNLPAVVAANMEKYRALGWVE